LIQGEVLYDFSKVSGSIAEVGQWLGIWMSFIDVGYLTLAIPVPTSYSTRLK
jgi:hypothetical protein